jgi:hypothetical protein
MINERTWFVVTVEHPATGIRGEHYQYQVFPSSAVEAEEALGFVVLGART